MKKKRKWSSNEELNFWQPASDMFSALLLILMLVILLLGLYLIHIPEHSQLDPWAGDTYAESGDEEPESTITPRPSTFFWMADNGGGSDGDSLGRETPPPTYVLEPSETPSVSPSVTPTISPTPDLEGGGSDGGGGGEGGGDGEGEGPGDDPDMGMKSAVYVMLVDGETERTVKQAEVQFELYGENHALQILNAYYPERLSFRFYETTESGTFFFPEKLQLGEYELHELTEPEGYDAAPNIQFFLEETYDWSDPLVVQVPVYPSRNVIRVQMTDSETGRGIPGGSFDVIAAENIITADGTLRCREGQVVDRIACDEDGYGESEELYLGKYLLRQRQIPEYYAALEEEPEVEVGKLTDAASEEQTLPSDRTRVHLKVTDELYPTRGVAGATFSLIPTAGGETIEVVTDSMGEATADALEKGTTYRVRQDTASGDYLPLSSDAAFTVTSLGYIDEEPEATLEFTNRMIRVQIGLTDDEFSNVQVPGVNMALYSEEDELIYSWTTSGSAMTFSSLKPGAYYLLKGGETDKRYEIRVQDTAEIQNIDIHTTYVVRYIIIGAAIVLFLLMLILTVAAIRRRRKKRAEKQGE